MVLHFPPFRLDADNEQLWREQQEIPLRRKTFAILQYLVEHTGRLVTKDELLQAVWGETLVSEEGLRDYLREIRHALGDDAGAPRFVETVRGRGYRFLPSITTQLVSSSKSQVPSLISSPVPSPQPLAPSEALPLLDNPSIIVLPFVNLSNDPEQEYFSDGITEDITNSLSRLSSLFVISRTSAFTYKGKAAKVRDISREMGVRYVLEGSVRKSNEQIRVTVQLVDATSDHHLWAERYDCPLTDIFAVQDEIVQRIVTTLNLQLTLQEQGHIVRKRTDNLEAYDTFLRGADYFYRYTKEGIVQARPLFEKAIELDPQYAEAYAWLGYTYLLAWAQQWDPDLQNQQRAFDVEQKALALDDTLPRAHIILSWVYMFQVKYEPAVAEAERAIALDPNNADGYYVLAGVFNVFGERTVEAIELLEKAIRLNLRYPFEYAFHLGWASNLVGRYEEAIAAQKQALLHNPNWLAPHLELFLNYRQLWSSQLSHDPRTLDRALEAAQQAVVLDAASPWAHRALSEAYLWKKQYEQAGAEAERALALNPSRGEIYAALANTLSFLGRSEEALGLIGKVLHINPQPPPRTLPQLGHTYYLTGQSEEAIAALKKSLNGSPADLDAHLLLAAVYSEVGKETEARAETAEILRINPKFILEVHKERVPIKDPAVLERHITALRRAGLK